MAKKKTTKKTTSKKTPRKSASAARAESAAKTERALREAKRNVDANLKAAAAADQENARVRDDRKASADGKTASERAMAKSSKATKAARATTAATAAKGKASTAAKAKGAKVATRAKRGRDEKRLSLLDRAAAILAKAKEPMGCKDIVTQALAGGWTTNGKTPAATLYAAVIREIATKGADARFEKVDRGRFQIRGKKA